MTFKDLLALVSSPNRPRICVDSRLVKEGNIFVAVKGTVYDGHDFVGQALANGAKYIICQQTQTSTSGSTEHETVVVDDSSEAAALLAQASRGNPASLLTNLAVTGTNGKTTVAYLVRSIIQESGEKCGLIGTVVCDTGQTCRPANLTTPDCLEIADAQRQMVEAKTRYMAIEASSHALSQNRLAGIDFKAAAFTNLAGDHLDYHITKDDYLAAKARLFRNLSPDATAVLNRQSPEAVLIARQTRANILWYATDEPADITARIESMSVGGTVFALEYAGQKREVLTPLLGRYNVSNHLAAAGLCLAAGFGLDTVAAGLSSLQAIPGRLEKCATERTDESSRDEFSVLVDYAHTDDALKNVLSTLKPLCRSRLIVVFGCGGDRDTTKRPRMARVAERTADIVIVTSDNPRTEQPDQIIEDIIAGFENYHPTDDANSARDIIVIEPDRRKAIELALRTAVDGDIVLIAGKGHETYQIIGRQKFDFSDKQVVQEYFTRVPNVTQGVSELNE
ncbi:MAG: UDP-N-acetylmuramoyl-L-alanyl-D-glutamate--2,6-diaminopimelate ligase [Phycisphaerales bacterium]|nr:MAG: UDP-N-acetylmuramoyl-L-alanyl-D-glutamate--2,6-diaminopimelate ligase [Phycisphaerales bacterium]